MRGWTLVALLVLASGCASPPSRLVRRVATPALLACMAADAATTAQALRSPTVTELNPLLGPRPSNGRLVATVALQAAALAWLADYAGARYPKLTTAVVGAQAARSCRQARRNAQLVR